MPKSKKQGDTEGIVYRYGNVHTAGGDFIGHDQINHFQVNCITYQAEEADNQFAKLINTNPKPYFPDRPFLSIEKDLFASRKKTVAQTISRIYDDQQRTFLLSGSAEVGKSSFLNAGIIPEIGSRGVHVVHLNDYIYPEAFVRSALLGKAAQVHVDVKESATLPEIVEKLTTGTDKGVILILDQFERYYLTTPTPVEQEALHQYLGETLQIIPPEYFKILIAIRQDWHARFDQEWGDELPGARINPMQILPLSTEEARIAIEHPIAILRKYLQGVQYSETIVEQRLLPDLDALDDKADGSILPSDLQIVCDRLFKTAINKPKPLITETLYLEASQGKGVEKILDLHFASLLDQIPTASQRLAREIASTMLDAAPQFWMEADQIKPEGANRQEIEQTLAYMSEAGLLIWHHSDEQKAYAFASQSIANAAYRTAGPEARRRFQSGNELKYVWRAWNTYDALANPAQLNYLQEYSPPADEFLPERAILLLRSALAERLDIAPWLERLLSPASTGMLKRLEDGLGTGPDHTDRLTRYNQLLTLLGAYDLKSNRNYQELQPGMISRTAVEHPEPVCRQTAALALMAGYGVDALNRLETVVMDSDQSPERIAELRGTLAEGAQALDTYQQEMEPGKLGRKRLTELSQLLEKLKVWIARFETLQSSKVRGSNIDASLKQVKTLSNRLEQDLIAGRLDNLAREERSKQLANLSQALCQLKESIEDQSVNLHDSVETDSLEKYFHSFERLKKWIDQTPGDLENLTTYRENLQKTAGTIKEAIKKLPSRREKMRVWWWRFKQRFRDDWNYIGLITLGGALGGGLGLGTLRALLSIILWQNPGFWFYNYFPIGFIVGAGLSLGMVLTNIVKLLPTEHSPWAAGRRAFWLSLGLGAFIFTVANMLLFFILDPKSIVTVSIVPPLTFLAGVGLCLVLFDQPMAGWRIGLRQWLLRLTGVPLIFALIQIVFVLTEKFNLGLIMVFGWSGYFYRSNIDNTLQLFGQEGIKNIPGWFYYPSIIDSALTGIALAVGITLGLILAGQNYRRRERRAWRTGL